MDDMMRRHIDEFRANGGVLEGDLAGLDILLLHCSRSPTDEVRVCPLTYLEVDGGYAVFAANRGLDHDPSWLGDLQANPRTVVEVGTRTLPVRARIAKGDERTGLIEEQMRRLPFIAHFVRTSRRALPVVVLERE